MLSLGALAATAHHHHDEVRHHQGLGRHRVVHSVWEETPHEKEFGRLRHGPMATPQDGERSVFIEAVDDP